MNKKSNEEIWDDVFKELDEHIAEKKEYLKTDRSPWLTKTYSRDEKLEFNRIRALIYGMNTNSMYKHLNEGKLWSRAIREEMDRRQKTHKSPKVKCREYFEPDACPWCGLELEKTEDGNYRCYECGYDHLEQRDSYRWDEED